MKTVRKPWLVDAKSFTPATLHATALEAEQKARRELKREHPSAKFVRCVRLEDLGDGPRGYVIGIIP